MSRYWGIKVIRGFAALRATAFSGQMSRQKTDFLAPFREEEDSAEENLLRDTPSEKPTRQA